MTNDLAQRAAEELNVDAGTGCWNGKDLHVKPLQTTMRLLARIDELEAQTTRRSEPMPEPVPEWLGAKVLEELLKEKPGTRLTWYSGECIRTIARLIWERGDREPVDPVEALADEILTKHPFMSARAEVVIREAIKRGMELQKEANQ